MQERFPYSLFNWRLITIKSGFYILENYLQQRYLSIPSLFHKRRKRCLSRLNNFSKAESEFIPDITLGVYQKRWESEQKA